MRDANTVLGIIHDRGKRRLPLEDVYRQLFNPDLYLRAYGRLYRNDGAMTPGMTSETVDGMSMRKIDAIIEALRFERWKWSPARRVEIPKKDGRRRPLGLPTWSDKLLQEVMRSILEAYYEPQFDDRSHGYRPERGPATALATIQEEWQGTVWFIEGDIKGFFDNIDHTVLMSILRENIHDNRFLNLIDGLLKAGYCEEWKYRPTLSGTPQGGVISPLLANIYLDKLDQYVASTVLPTYKCGKRRATNKAYTSLIDKYGRARKQGKPEEARAYQRAYHGLPSVNPNDPNYRRLRYIRYADDFILGFAGPKSEAEDIKVQLTTFLRDTLKLELSEEKTTITHATTQVARFLGYDITVQRSPTRRSVNGHIALKVPPEFIRGRRARYMRKGIVHHRPELLNNSDFDIVAQYQSEYRGFVEYYALAQNLYRLNFLKYTMETSLLKTLAHKHKTSVMAMVKKHQATTLTPNGPRKCIEVTVTRNGKPDLKTHFGGISLVRRQTATLVDRPEYVAWANTTELVQRLLADTCEVCGSRIKVNTHHIRRLASINRKGRKPKPFWMRLMIAHKRKALVLCQACHHDLHAGRPLAVTPEMELKLLASRVR